MRRDGSGKEGRNWLSSEQELLFLLSDVEEVTLLLLSICLEKLVETWYKEGDDL